MNEKLPDQQPPRKRGRVRYFNGEKWRFGDSLRLQRCLYIALGGEGGDREAVGKVLADSSSNDAAVSGPATDKLVAAVREVFEMTPFDAESGTGSSETDVRDALAALWESLPNDDKQPAVG